MAHFLQQAATFLAYAAGGHIPGVRIREPADDDSGPPQAVGGGRIVAVVDDQRRAA